MVRGDGGTTVNLITTCYKEGIKASISGHVEPKSVKCFLRQMPFDLKTNKGKIRYQTSMAHYHCFLKMSLKSVHKFFSLQILTTILLPDPSGVIGPQPVDLIHSDYFD